VEALLVRQELPEVLVVEVLVVEVLVVEVPLALSSLEDLVQVPRADQVVLQEDHVVADLSEVPQAVPEVPPLVAQEVLAVPRQGVAM